MERGWTRAALAAALVVAGAGTAQAATLTVTDTGTLGTGSEVPLSVAAFDTSLGTLTAVAWAFEIAWTGATVVLSNPTTTPLRPNNGLEVYYSYSFATLPQGPALAGLTESYASPDLFFLADADGSTLSVLLAPGAEVAVPVPGFSQSRSGSTAEPFGLGAGTPADWQGPGTIDLTVIPFITVFEQLTAITSRESQDLTATLSVTYTYDPVTGGGGGPTDPVDPVPVVPLPAGLPLMLGGLAALAVLRRRRGVA
jgi:hypothetical protein